MQPSNLLLFIIIIRCVAYSDIWIVHGNFNLVQSVQRVLNLSRTFGGSVADACIRTSCYPTPPLTPYKSITTLSFGRYSIRLS